MPRLRPTRLASLALVLALLLQAGWAVSRMSMTWDEGDHLYSGLCQWTRGETALNPEHPPLAKLVAALPLLPLHLKIAPRSGSYFKNEAYGGGSNLLFHNGRYTADTLLLRAHLAMLVFAAALATMVFFAAREMFGDELASVIALALLAFDTTVLAHAPMVATDTAASCGFFAAAYALYRYVKQPGPARLLLAGLGAGLALSVKHSAVLLVGILPLLLAGEFLGRWWSARQQRRPFHTARLAAQYAGALVAMSLLAALVLWAVYGFRFHMRAAGVTLPDIHGMTTDLGTLRGGIILFFLRWHLLPESYLYGLADVFRVSDTTATFLLGKIYSGGLWYFFPVALSMKWSLAFLLLFAATLWTLLTGRLRHRARELWFLLLPPAVYLGAAMQARLAIGVRHSLPIFAFLFVLTGGCMAALARRSRPAALAIVALLVWHAASSLRMFPNYFPYENALWGGPSRTWLHVADSTVDWGSQLHLVKAWSDQHHLHDCHFAYFVYPVVDPRDYGIPCDPLPTFDSQGPDTPDVPEVIHGTLLINSSNLNGFEFGTKVLNPYQSLVGRTPDAVIANSVLVFHGEFRFPLARAQRWQGIAGKLMAKDPAGALAAADHALALDPESFGALILRADALSNLDRKDEARATLAHARHIVDTEMEPSARAFWADELDSRLRDLNGESD